ncbi:endolytic transglycosylase MltG [Rathayibacter toxicus]|uniref:Endolytic murein transglycosylase n=1 Tax=Rathayibacter toxicus TaxID=145458 RepID=A0A2S5Y5P5_9MICO|nr:endolytic transglycosylase MltG [Rathayibacter toxicus]PPG45378.1 endolytic transglycosylase MltG [Rathayibacter toxicus]PPH22481.1 endolytic transglycosylase MltG [Rathayibacter toxicus]PPH57122.1 endolytic transglycosylase MltG [Rathayibacter toxicus]PPH59375.1 endolytic transglycosylase MltG [Rathayibacter toxicus]
MPSIPSARPVCRLVLRSNRTKDHPVTNAPPNRRAAPAAEPTQSGPRPNRNHSAVASESRTSSSARVAPDRLISVHDLPRRRRDTRKKKRRTRRALVGGVLAVVAFIVLIAVAGVIFIKPLRTFFADAGVTDYTGTGTSEVIVTIHGGDDGNDIAHTLVAAGVIKSYEPFYRLLLAQSPEPVFQPGAYALKTQMSSKAALSSLLDPGSTRLANTFVIPEGTVLKDALTLIADGTGVTRSDLEAAAADYSSFGLPKEATSLEGFLFPARYNVNRGQSAHEILQTLVNRMFAALDRVGVAQGDRYHAVVFASLVQREARIATDFPKVARVFQNRLDRGMRLQSDATVAYGTGATNRVSTTDAERANPNNPYNTYLHVGLPPGPISNPGDIAIDAAFSPAEGTWLYFVTVNLETGQTVFSTTDAEHDAAVQQWQAWMREHPEYR